MDFGVVSVDDLTSGRLHGRVAAGAQLPAVRVPRHARAAPGVCGRDHRRGAEPVAAAARGNPDPLGLRRPRAPAAGGARRTAGTARQTEAAGDAPGRSARLGALHARAARRGRRGGYVAHRLQVAGGSPDRIRFSPEAIEAVYRVSGGVPRLINRSAIARCITATAARRARSIRNPRSRDSRDDAGAVAGPAARGQPSGPGPHAPGTGCRGRSGGGPCPDAATVAGTCCGRRCARIGRRRGARAESLRSNRRLAERRRRGGQDRPPGSRRRRRETAPVPAGSQPVRRVIPRQ